ncbi:MAG: hypothetical protein KF773_13200 [Deltaproteobacteria bacterium]|nr:hypothetical protein [Deltaproteobacteria bacterium]
MSNLSLAKHSSGKLFQVVGLALLLMGAGSLVFALVGPASLDEDHQRLIVKLAAGLFAGLAVFFIYLGAGLNNLSVRLAGGDLEIRGPLYGRTIPRSSLRMDQAKIVELKGNYAPAKRRNGVGLPHLKFGWFRLENEEKALVVAGEQDRAVYVPTTEGYALLVTPSDPEAFLNAVRT